MADKAPTLSQALAEHMKASGETLEQLNEKLFVADHLQGGKDYLEQLSKGRGDEPLYGGLHATGGPRMLAAYLIAQRPRLRLQVFPMPPVRVMDMSGSPVRNLNTHKRSPRNDRDF